MRLSIALCTYNGSAFLREQLDSFLAQSTMPDELVVCDDGSTDATLDILEQFSARAPFPVRVHRNVSNLGVRANFVQATGLCSGDFIALADQDDVWLPDKLERAERALLTTADPANGLYCTRLQYVDARLLPLGLSAVPTRIGFDNAIVENIATGCSAVFGKGIRDLMIRSDPAHMEMHDWWIYLIASAFGAVIYDREPSLLYRQHGGSVTGWEPRAVKIRNRCISLAQRLKAGSDGMDSLQQAARFMEDFPELAPEKRALVQGLLQLRDAGPLARLQYALVPEVGRNDWIENLGLRAMLLMGWH